MPVGPYETFEECVAANQDKDNPQAYCAVLKAETMGKLGRKYRYDGIDFKAPQGARDEAQRGLDWRREHGRGGTEVGIARARDIARGANLSPQTMRRMLNFFQRHEGNKSATGFSPGEDGYPSNGRIAWALWGGDPGFAWARKVVRQMDAREDKATLEAQPGGGVLPEAYRPAVEDDVPEGRACGNCVFYDESKIHPDGVQAWCSFWAAYVRGDHYCNAWQEAGEDTEMTASRASWEITDEDEMPQQEAEAAQITSGPVWEGIIAVENTMTGDGRMFETGAMRWDNLPVPLRWVEQDVGEHLNAVVVGRVDEVWRDGANIMGRGVFDAGSEKGREAARQVKENLTPGVSVDLDDVSFEIRVRADVDAAEEPEIVEDPSGMRTVMEYSSDEEVMVTTDARLRALTIVATPAFAEAKIAIADDMDMTLAYPKKDDEMVAGAAPVFPPTEWFKDPALKGPTPLTIAEDGRVFGHLATWGTCHTGFAGECVQPPSSATNYAFFRTGAVRTNSGEVVPVGRLTLDTTHAGRRLSSVDTAAHYEHTGVAVADVSAGEDSHGIWLAGALRPDATDEQIRVLQASPLSGDWRRVGGNLELVAALAVNSPGFPVPRALVASGEVFSLLSSGVVSPEPVVKEVTREQILQRLIDREIRDLTKWRSAAEKERIRVKAQIARAKVNR